MNAAEQIAAIAAKALKGPEFTAKTMTSPEAMAYVGALAAKGDALAAKGDKAGGLAMYDLAAKAVAAAKGVFIEKAQTSGVFNVIDLGDTTATEVATAPLVDDKTPSPIGAVAAKGAAAPAGRWSKWEEHQAKHRPDAASIRR